jgi:hypothetical protein
MRLAGDCAVGDVVLLELETGFVESAFVANKAMAASNMQAALASTIHVVGWLALRRGAATGTRGSMRILMGSSDMNYGVRRERDAPAR